MVSRWMSRNAAICLAFTGLFTHNCAQAQNLDLYVDAKTKQVFTEPGAGRTKLGTFQPSTGSATEGKIEQNTSTSSAAPAAAGSNALAASTAHSDKPASGTPEKHWYEKLSLRGYTQFRYTKLISNEGADFFHPADRTVSQDQTFLIRRGRVILSGDVSDHLFLYIQPELFGSPSDGDFSVQMRDVYGDLSFDKKKEFRLRLGESKVPYGFVNMQSSQNRLTLERADALNGAVEGERDIGAFFYWAPQEIRERFKKLVKDGLKGSGDYGVIGLGAYSGQGLNRTDTNGDVHTVARVSYPFLFDNGQFFETGVQAYAGRYVPKTQAVTLDGATDPSSPKFRSDGVKDQRMAFTAVVYPQPIGFEAEWNFGQGPELSDDYTSISSKSLNGGYLLANAKIDSDVGPVLPFVRWQYFDGGRKFGKNAPSVLLNEWDFGVEWQPIPEFELTAQYSYTNERTNSNSYPYAQLTDGSRLGIQAQFNY